MRQGSIDPLTEITRDFTLIYNFMIEIFSIINWSVFLSTTVGGFATIFAAYLTFRWGSRAEHERQAKSERRASAANAMSGYFKLAQWADLIGNIKLHIDESFEAAIEGGITPTEPFALVGPSSGIFTEPERLKPEEFSFLISREKYYLIDKIGLIERRGANYNYLLSSYSSMHNSLQD